MHELEEAMGCDLDDCFDLSSWSEYQCWWTISGWWFGTFFHSVGNAIIPTDFHSIIFQRGYFSTTNQIIMIWWGYIIHYDYSSTRIWFINHNYGKSPFCSWVNQLPVFPMITFAHLSNHLPFPQTWTNLASYGRRLVDSGAVSVTARSSQRSPTVMWSREAVKGWIKASFPIGYSHINHII